MRVLTAAAAVCLLAPPAAHAAQATLVARDVPVGAARTLTGTAAPVPFDLVGLHWRGSGSVSFRTRSLEGGWSRWQAAAPEGEDQPDAGTAEAMRSAGWQLGNPWWTGPAVAIQYRLHGRVTRLRTYFVTSQAERIPLRRLSLSGSPAIVPRLSWSANERIRRAPPVYASAVRLALVHHTAGSNRYSPSQSPAIVRAIELYHVLGNGWNDIGYNFLVDKYGQIFEGRYGGVDRNVVGAHAQGFNTGSVGIALIGNYQTARPTAAAQRALESLLAWRLDLAHVDPTSTLTYISGGNPRFPPGDPVFLRAISGHRDAGFTDCPGAFLYARLNLIAHTVSTLGLPKLYDPSVTGAIGKTVRFTARLSTYLPWTVAVSDPSGQQVAAGSGTGTIVDWTWDATLALPGTYSYAISAGPDVQPALGTFGGPLPALKISDVTATPSIITPNGDGIDDTSTIAYTLSSPATLSASLVDPAGTTISRLFSDLKPAGRQIFTFAADNVPDGSYLIVLNAADTRGRKASASVSVTVTRTQGGMAGGPR